MPRELFKILLTGLLLAGCGGDNTQVTPQSGGMAGGFGGMEAVPVRVEPVASGSISSYILKTTNLEADREVVILSRVQGPMTSLLVEEGDRVRQDQVLAKVDEREYQLEVDDAHGRMEKARIEYERTQKLFEEKMVAEQQVDNLKITYETAKADLERAELNLAYATIRSPFSGVVTHRMCEIGMMVRNNVEVFRVVDDTPILARIHVPEKEMGRLSSGQQARVRVETQKDHDFEGKVQLISPVVDPMSGTIKVTVEINEHGGALRPGMFAEVFIITETHENSKLIPKRALLLETEEDMVFAYENGTARRTPIEIGFIDGDRVEVLAGLDYGQQIITIGQEGLRDGAAVRIPAEGETVGTAPQSTASAGGEGQRGGRGGRGGMNLTPEEQAKVATMSQEERRAFFQQKRTEMQASGAGQAQAAVPAATGQTPPAEQNASAASASSVPAAAAAAGVPPNPAGNAVSSGESRRGGRGGMNLTPEEQEQLAVMSPEERQAFFQQKRAASPAGAADQGERIDRVLNNLMSTNPQIKDAYMQRLSADPSLKTDVNKKAEFLKEMLAKIQTGQ